MPSAPRPSPRRLRLTLALVLGAAAIACAGVRWRQCAQVIPAAEIRFSELSAMSWNPASGQLAKTGGDPHGRLVLPATAVPVCALTLVCRSGRPASDGGFYIYQYPYHLPGEVITEKRVATGRLEPSSGGFAIRWTLADSKLVRLDLPDELAQPITVERLILRSRFLAIDQWACTGFLVTALAAAVLLLWPPVSAACRRQPWVEALAALALLAGAVALARDVPLQFAGSAIHDEALFAGQAASILDGHWLGKYTDLTLSKGPAYPVFLALTGWSGVPLRTAQALLHGFGALAFVIALRRLLPSSGLRLLLLAVLLFEPNALSASAVGRVLRSGIQPGLTLLTLAGVIGLAGAAARSRAEMLAWSLLTGVAGGAFWYSREEGIWLAPSVALLLAPAVVFTAAKRSPGWVTRLCLFVLPFAMLAGWTGTLRRINARHYGAPIAVDVKDGYFPKAYGALLRIRPREFIPGVPVARETRLRAYAVSPAFATLQKELEGEIGNAWARFGWENISHPAAGKEIRGGWFQWALRQTAGMAGHYRDAATADLFWRSVAREINRACDDGRLAAGPWRSGFFPRWDPSLWRPLQHSWLVGWQRAAQVTDFSLQPPPSTGTATQLVPFIRVTHEPVMTEPPAPTARTVLRAAIALGYLWLGGLLSLAALVATIGVAIATVRRRSGWAKPVVLLALLGGAAALVTVIALVDVTSFSAVHSLYLAPATPLIAAWWVLSLGWAWSIFAPRSAS